MLSVAQASHACVCWCVGMNYLHHEAPLTVLHRDLKSKNGESATGQGKVGGASQCWLIGGVR